MHEDRESMSDIVDPQHHRRPRRGEWIRVLGLGAGLGFLLLGIGGRAGMRVIASASDQPAVFTFEGSLTVALLGALAGAVMSALFLIGHTVFPTRPWLRGAVFWLVCGALVLRGLNPVTRLNAVVFAPLFVLHGVLLHMYWRRTRTSP